MTFVQLLEWQNLIFVLPFVGALVYLLMMVAGVVGDHDHDISAEHDIGHELEHGVEHTVGEHEHEVGHDHDHESFGLKVLQFLGVGRVPFSYLVLSLCFLWGFFGWASNLFLSKILVFPVVYFWISLAAAFFATVFFVRHMTKVIAKVMPATETYGQSDRELAGSVAEVRFTVTADSGTATLYDRYRNFREVQCRVRANEAPLTAGAKIVLGRYYEENKFFLVGPVPKEMEQFQ